HRPKKMTYIMLGVAERMDVWIDFKDRPVGTEITLKSLSFSAGMMNKGMMGGMMGGMNSSIPLGSEYPVMKIVLEEKGNNKYVLPRHLVAYDKFDPKDAINQNNPRKFRFFMQRMRWTINGRTWEPTGVTEEETVKLNTTEIWKLINGNRGKMGGKRMMGGRMQMPHPIHIHQLQFNILERDVSDMEPEVWDSVKEGFIEDGWQDTTLLMPGMKIKIIMRF